MKKLSRIIIQLLPVLVVIIVTVIVAVIGYSNIMEWEEDQCWSVLQNAADDVNEQIQIRLEDNGNFLKMTAGSILDGNALQDDQKLASKLKEVQDTTIFTRMEVLFRQMEPEFRQNCLLMRLQQEGIICPEEEQIPRLE